MGDLAIASRSAAAAAAADASRDIRALLLSWVDEFRAAAKFPVLRFFGRESAIGNFSRPRSSSPVWFSAPWSLFPPCICIIVGVGQGKAETTGYVVSEGLREACSGDGGVEQEISVGSIAQSSIKIETSRRCERKPYIVCLSKKRACLARL
jgi:hypothetical protein